jgi:hypothetical protein
LFFQHFCYWRVNHTKYNLLYSIHILQSRRNFRIFGIEHQCAWPRTRQSPDWQGRDSLVASSMIGPFATLADSFNAQPARTSGLFQIKNC